MSEVSLLVSGAKRSWKYMDFARDGFNVIFPSIEKRGHFLIFLGYSFIPPK